MKILYNKNIVKLDQTQSPKHRKLKIRSESWVVKQNPHLNGKGNRRKIEGSGGPQTGLYFWLVEIPAFIPPILPMNGRSFWRTRFGFYMAAIGSALGLANLWRFPYVVGENGGGAIVLLYVLVAMIIGLPMLIAELMLGKISRRSVVQAFANFGPQYTWIGRFVVGLTILVLAYYAVISGWVLYLLASFVTKALVPALPFTTSLKVLMDNGWLQLGVVSIHLLIGVLIIGKDLQEGLERWVSVMMPLFALFLIMMLILSLSLPSALTSFRFLFYPDFSELRPSSLIQAIGHVFFTLSIGFGVMITFGRYMSERKICWHLYRRCFFCLPVYCGSFCHHRTL